MAYIRFLGGPNSIGIRIRIDIYINAALPCVGCRRIQDSCKGYMHHSDYAED